MSILDLGGGFPSGELSEKTLNALKVTEKDPLGYKVLAEPGRHFSANSFYLLTRVLGKRLKNGKTCYHLNESLYHSFNCNLMDGVSFENSLNQFYSKIDS
jgi:diaminopimelate decarboxylase